jgi:hypothetical protein
MKQAADAVNKRGRLTAPGLFGMGTDSGTPETKRAARGPPFPEYLPEEAS